RDNFCTYPLLQLAAGIPLLVRAVEDALPIGLRRSRACSPRINTIIRRCCNIWLRAYGAESNSRSIGAIHPVARQLPAKISVVIRLRPDAVAWPPPQPLRPSCAPLPRSALFSP